MMKLSRLDDLAVDAGRDAAAQARTLAIACLGVIWLFAGPFFQGAVEADPPSTLFIAGAFFVACLILDLLQLFLRASLLRVTYWWQEKKLQAEMKGNDPAVESLGGTIGYISFGLFIAKGVALLVGFAFLVVYFVSAASRQV